MWQKPIEECYFSKAIKLCKASQLLSNLRTELSIYAMVVLIALKGLYRGKDQYFF